MALILVQNQYVVQLFVQRRVHYFGSAVSKYNSSQITASHQTNLGIKNIQPHMVLQNSNDWIESAKISIVNKLFLKLILMWITLSG